MVIINGEDVKVFGRSLKTHEYLPDEIWFEILSRLPIKSLLRSHCVCKLWKNLSFTLENKIYTDPLYVPVCGLLLLFLRTKEDYSFSYFCLTTKKNHIIQYDSPEKKLFYSGFERGLMSDSSFDFSVIREFTHDARRETRFASYVLNGGLLLVIHTDGTSQVQNPATKQIHYVPKSQFVAKHGFKYHLGTETCGVIIQFPSHLIKESCRFIVVRFCIHLRIMEVYYSVTRMWKIYCLKIDDELLSSVCWSLPNYVCVFESGTLSLYVMTNKDCGIAIKFKEDMNSEIMQCTFPFPLPQVALGGYPETRIWECENSLYLSYCNATSLLIWKASSTQVDTWSWVSVLEISPARQSCKPAAREYLSKVVLSTSDRVTPLACHPNDAVVYLLVNSSIFTYNLNTDSLERIAEIKDQEHLTCCHVQTFKPCLSIMDASEES